MPTKYKIIGGFSLVVVLLLVLAVIGYTGLSTASNLFDEYARVARLNTTVSDINTEMTLTRLRNQQAINTLSKDRLAEAHEHISNVLKMANDALTMVARQDIQDSLSSGIAQAKSYEAYLDQINQGYLKALNIYNTDFQDSMQTLFAALTTVTEGATAANNDAVVLTIADFWKYINRGSVFVARYVESRDNALNEEARGNLQTAHNMLEAKLSPIMLSAAGRRDYKTISDAMVKVQNAYSALSKQVDDTAAIVDKSTAAAAELGNILFKVNEMADAQAYAYRDETIASNSSSQTMMLGVSIFGVILGTALATLTTISLIRTLAKMSRYAEAIARGNFKYDAQIKEKAEIGKMLEALQGIPDVLQGIVQASNQLSQKVTHGHLRSNIDESQYEGAFVTLANSLNNLSQAYVDILDVLPVSLMAGDTNRRIVFANQIASQLGGSDNLIGEFCGDKIGSNVCHNSDLCPGLKSLSSGASCKGEATVDSGGNHTDLDLQIMPLTDDSGHTIGFLEIATDITQIKTQQNIMLQVANQASEISDRVAAASEELSAQVEEVSRSAEMQRDRVESTASAMTEMNSTVLEVARNAAQASEQSEETRSNADAGASLVNQVVDSINRVNAVAAHVQKNMEGLGEQAENIGGVMNVISDIADQTNLLALNAAIEAARAGEAGRGFAVVADEVRKLAEKTMAATQEVGSSISAIQQSAQSNISEVRGVVESVTEATGLANSSGESLAGILNLASATSSVVTSIATAAEEQSATSEEITRAIDEINKIVGDTTEGMIQSSAAVQELSRMTQELNRVISTLK